MTIDFSQGDWIRDFTFSGIKDFGELYMSKDHHQLSIIIMENNSWNSVDGLMISAPASNRKEALLVSNSVLKELFIDEFKELK